MKHLLIIFTLLLTSVSWSEDIDSNDLVERDGLWYKKFTNEPFTGNSKGERQGKIIDGKEEGEWVAYFPNGQLFRKWNYQDGKPEGEWFRYHPNGQICFKSNYKDGKREGAQYFYSDDGQLVWRTNYKDGKEEGEQLHYYDNGQLMRKSIYKDGNLIEGIDYEK